jgi:hypothetical protein
MKRSRRNTGQRLLPLGEAPSWTTLAEELRGQIVELWSQILGDQMKVPVAPPTENQDEPRENHPRTS